MKTLFTGNSKLSNLNSGNASQPKLAASSEKKSPLNKIGSIKSKIGSKTNDSRDTAERIAWAVTTPVWAPLLIVSHAAVGVAFGARVPFSKEYLSEGSKAARICKAASAPVVAVCVGGVGGALGCAVGVIESCRMLKSNGKN